MDSFLGQAIIYLSAAIVCVPLAKLLGMGSVLGYLAAGIIIGPFCLGCIGAEGQDVMHFAEFGVVMMLFLIGLELEPTHFWGMRKYVLGLGSLQVILTTLAAVCTLTLLGFSWEASLATGLALSMSSTAMVLQSLKEKGLGQTEAGRSCLAVLLLQDIAVIPVLVLLPFLALQKDGPAKAAQDSALSALPGWVQASSVLFAILLVIVGGRYVIVPFLRAITRTRLRELCIAASLLIIAAIAYLMKLAGLSPALGTFLAGVVLANSEFRHELESDIEPFKGLLLGLFFIAVGASVNFRLILNNPAWIISLVTVLLVIKTAVLLLVGRLFKLRFDQNCIFSLALSQVGEFAFVLFAFIRQLQILSGTWADTMIALTALSMIFTPVLLLINERFILPHFGTLEHVSKEGDTIDTAHPVIIAGFSFFGSTIGRFLRASGVATTILDNDSNRVDLLRKMGFKVFYGDATRLDMLHSAGAASARILVIAIDDPAISFALADTVRKNFPQLSVIARARDNPDAYELLDLGLRHIYRDCLDTALRAAVDVLVLLGLRRFSATRAAQNFIKYDEAALRILSPHRHDEKTYISNSKEQILMQEQLLSYDRQTDHSLYDHAWDTAQLSCAISTPEE